MAQRFPRGIEAVLARAAADPNFHQRLLTNRAAALAEAGTELSPAERDVLSSIPDAELQEAILRLRETAEGKGTFFRDRPVTRGLAWGSAAALALGLGGALCIPLTATTGARAEHVHSSQATANLKQLQLAALQYRHEHGAYAPPDRLVGQDQDMEPLLDELRRDDRHEYRMALTADGFRIYALPREERRSLKPFVIDEQGKITPLTTPPSPLPPLVAPPEAGRIAD